MSNDWQTVKLGDICEFENGDRSSNYPTDKDYVNSGGFPFINAGNLVGNKIGLKDLKYISEEAKDRLTSGKFKEGDIVFCLRGSLGKYGIVQKGLSGAIASSLVIVRPKEKIVNKYLYYYFASSITPRMIESYSGGAAQPNLGVKDFKEFEIPLPDIIVQEQVVHILEAWDEFLGKLDKKIAAKKNVKNGLMQQLLSGKVRLPGFDERWTPKTLGDVSNIKTGKKDNKDKVESGEYPFFVRSPIIERINTYSFDGEAILIPGEGNIGKIFHYINGKFDFHQRVYKISNFDKGTNGKFIYYLLSKDFANHTKRHSVKATVDSLRLPTFKMFEYQAPNRSEQDAIAEVLSVADEEIELLSKERGYIAEQRKYLLNNLINGKIRVPESVQAEKLEVAHA